MATLKLDHPLSSPASSKADCSGGQLKSPEKKATIVARKRVEAAKRAFVFFHRKYPVKMHENVAADLGCSASTIRKMEERQSAPSLPLFCMMVEIYGPEFLHAVTGWQWLDRDVREAKRAALREEIAKIERDLASLREGA